MMYEDIIRAKRFRECIRVFFLKDGGKIIGWASFLTPPPKPFANLNDYPIPSYSKSTPVYTYVNKAYRKLGLGKRLLIAASRYAVGLGYKPVVFFWNESSSAFFVSAQASVEELEVFDVSEWWDVAYGVIAA